MDYFLAFDYWTTTQSKFFSGIVSLDLSETSLQQACRDRIKSLGHNEHVDTWAIKVIAFNNITSK